MKAVITIAALMGYLWVSHDDYKTEEKYQAHINELCEEGSYPEGYCEGRVK